MSNRDLFVLWILIVVCMAVSFACGYGAGRDSWTRPITAEQHAQNELAETYALIWVNGDQSGAISEEAFKQFQKRLKVRDVSPAVDNTDLMNVRRSLYFSTTGYHNGKPYSATLQAFYQSDSGCWYFPAIGFVWFTTDAQKALDGLHL